MSIWKHENALTHFLAQFLQIEKIEDSGNVAPKGERPIEFEKKDDVFAEIAKSIRQIKMTDAVY